MPIALRQPRIPRLLAVATALALAIAPGLAAPAVASDDVARSVDVVDATDTSGLFGAQDPTYDGVYRQSMALMGLVATGRTTARPAVAWLLDQQCAEGSFTAYRSDPAVPCAPWDPATFSGQDTNATAIGALALRALGRDGRADRAVAWLLRAQTRGGGWPWFVGGQPDAISTGLVLTALAGVPGTKGARQAGERYLRRLAVGCSAPPAERFAMPFQPGFTPDPLSTSQSLLGLGRGLPVADLRQRAAIPTTTCSPSGTVSDVRKGTARWVARTIVTNGGVLPSVYEPGATDWNATALGVLGLVSTRVAGRATGQAVTALKSGVDAYVGDAAGDRPAALGTLLLVTAATGESATDFGGHDLRTRLLATLQP